jgi:hypothetical protein
MKKVHLKMMRVIKILLFLIFIFLILWYFPDFSNIKPKYGATFSARYARDLGLDPVDVYEDMINDMGIKRMRLVAYWDQIERDRDNLDFSTLDWQIEMSEEEDVEVILSIGRRVPRWPECHIPGWVHDLSDEEKAKELKDYVSAVIERYKGYESIKIWQVENEAFFNVYATEICGLNVNDELIDEEISLVRELDPTRQILMTDSGNLGIWSRAYKRGDIFGSTFYVYLMFDGEFASPLTQNVYKWKKWFNSILFGEKDVYLIEISIEPWLNDPIAEVPIDELVRRLSLDREENILNRAKKTGFEYQYLWGIEWIYYMKENNHPGYWEFFKDVFNR